MLILIIGMIITLAFNIGWWHYVSKGIIGMIPFITCTISILIYISIILKIRSRRELRTKQRKGPKEFWKWDSKELTAEKIRIAFHWYQHLSNKAIESLVHIAEKHLSEPVKNPFNGFQKLTDYTLRILLGVVITVILFELEKDYSWGLVKVCILLILKFILLYGMLVGTWYFFFLNHIWTSLTLKKSD